MKMDSQHCNDPYFVSTHINKFNCKLNYSRIAIDKRMQIGNKIHVITGIAVECSMSAIHIVILLQFFAYIRGPSTTL